MKPWNISKWVVFMKKLIPMTRNFGKLINGRCFGMYGMIIFENSKTIQTSLNFNPNYFTLFPNNYLVLLITISFLSLTHSPTWIWKIKLTCAFSLSMVFIVIRIKLNLESDINNDELLKKTMVHGKMRRGWVKYSLPPRP